MHVQDHRRSQSLSPSEATTRPIQRHSLCERSPASPGSSQALISPPRSGLSGRSGAIFAVRLTNQPGLLPVGSRSSTRREMPRPLALGPGWCLPGGRARDPARCSQADAARAATPPYAARAAQPLTLAWVTITGVFGLSRGAGGITGAGRVRPDPCPVNAAVSHHCSP